MREGDDGRLTRLTGDRAEVVRPAAERAGIDEVIELPFTAETVERSFLRALTRVGGRTCPPGRSV